MVNPLLTESTLPYGAPPFDKIRNEHYMPAFGQALAEAKAEIDAIAANPAAPTFQNTIAALENAGLFIDLNLRCPRNLFDAYDYFHGTLLYLQQHNCIDFKQCLNLNMTHTNSNKQSKKYKP